MTRFEFENLKIGDVVIIVIHGKNQGKQGIVRDIWKRGGLSGGSVYLEPLNCEFEFFDARRQSTNKDGFYRFSHTSVSIIKLKNLVPKECYIAERYGGDGVSWPLVSYSEKEVEVIERFMKEFNEHAEGLDIESVHIWEIDED